MLYVERLRYKKFHRFQTKNQSLQKKPDTMLEESKPHYSFWGFFGATLFTALKNCIFSTHRQSQAQKFLWSNPFLQP